jgi:hypothetical protein
MSLISWETANPDHPHWTAFQAEPFYGDNDNRNAPVIGRTGNICYYPLVAASEEEAS